MVVDHALLGQGTSQKRVGIRFVSYDMNPLTVGNMVGVNIIFAVIERIVQPQQPNLSGPIVQDLGQIFIGHMCPPLCELRPKIVQPKQAPYRAVKFAGNDYNQLCHFRGLGLPGKRCVALNLTRLTGVMVMPSLGLSRVSCGIIPSPCRVFWWRRDGAK